MNIAVFQSYLFSRAKQYIFDQMNTAQKTEHMVDCDFFLKSKPETNFLLHKLKTKVFLHLAFHQ